MAFSPQAIYTDWSTANGQRILVPTLVVGAAELQRPLFSDF
jgi:hypothetical protein